MTFENQIWLTLTPLIVLLFAGLFAFGLRRREALLSRFAAARLLDQLTEKASNQRTLLKAGLILLAFALIGISLARPQYGVDWIERKARGLDIVFVLDSSKSMLATDLRPTRLERAKLAIIDLVKRLESDRIGLVAFAGSAFLQTPPTLDYSAFRENLDSIGHSSISRGGSDIGQAIREAAKAFPKDNNFKVVILLTDGEDQEQQAIVTAREVAKDGIKIYTIGIGTPEGEYLKIRNAQGDEEFIRDSSGQPVRSQLDEATLQEIAQLTGGIYSRLSDQSLNTLYNSVLATLPREERESELQEARIDRYQWTLSAACVFLVLEIFIRRRSNASIHLAMIVVGSSLLLPTPSEAQELPHDSTESLELPIPATEEPPEAIIHEQQTDPRILYNQAHEQLTAGDYAEATRLYEQAIELSENRTLERDALYNMAHATNQMGEAALQTQDFEAAIESWKQAEALFQSANEIDSSDTRSVEDATATEARRKALEEFLKQQEQQDQENSEDNEQEQQESEDESEEGEQGEEDQQSGDQSEESEQNQDEQSGEENQDEQSGDEGSESEQGQNGEEQPDSESESSEGSESEEQDEGENSESTGDPAEDMEQQAQEDAAGNESEEQPGEEGQEPMQPTEGEAGDEGSEEAAGEMTIEGMSVSEAQDLLDSLRGSERLLPFSEPSDETRSSNRKGEIRDW
jgi:Ca-activated chloride channel family protein